MSPIHSRRLLCVWALLASAPAWADEPAAPPPGPPGHRVESHGNLKGLADCPHCRKAGLVPAAVAASPAGAPEPAGDQVPSIALPNLAAAPGSLHGASAPPADARAMLDVDVRQIQVPPLAVPDNTPTARPRVSSASLPAPSPRPQLARPPSRSNAPGTLLAPRVPDPSLPAAASNPKPEPALTRSAAPAPGAVELPLPRSDQPTPIVALPEESVPDLTPPGEMASPIPTPAPALESRSAGPKSDERAQPIITYLPTPDLSPSPEPAPSSPPQPAPELASGPAPGPSAVLRYPEIPPAAEPAASAPSAPAEVTVVPPAPPGPEYGSPAVAAMPIVDGSRDYPGLHAYTYLPVMLGDQSPASLRTGFLGLPVQIRAIVPGQPPTPPSPFGAAAAGAGAAAVRPRSSALIPWARGFKIADNQSPMPQDRVFYSFNYFNNMNDSINRRLGSSVTGLQAYRQLLGIEKTFWGGNASLGLRLPIDTLSSSSRDPSLGGTSTSVGNVTVFSKFLLYDNPRSGSLLSSGLAVTAPTGPSSFAGSPASTGFHDVQIQPFVGYVLRRGDLFLQGFTAIDVPTDNRDVTMWYNDLAVGYFAYRNDGPSALLSAVVPTFEVHLNDPLSHRGALRLNDPAGTPDVLDLTFGSSFILRRRLVATLGCSFPVTGPQPFDIEALALLNFYYGRSGMATPWPMPPAGR